MAYQHRPSFRDAGLARVATLTTAFSVAGTVATAGVAAAIAAAAPNPKSASADYTKGKTAVQTKKSNGITPPADRPESSSGDEQTTSGGS